MRNIFLVAFILFVCAFAKAQTPVTPEYLQKELSRAKAYTLVFLMKGKEIVSDEQTAQRTQMEHLQYLFTLKENKHVSIFGPLTDGGSMRGILIFNSTDATEVKKFLDGDPHVKAGSLTYEIHPWFGIPGQTLAN
jgi:uncharacterized protein YciI